MSRPALIYMWDAREHGYLPAQVPSCVVTVAAADWQICGREIHRQAGGVGFCREHWDAAPRWEADDAASRLAYRREVEEKRRQLGLIYYVRRADGLIKIGTTWRLDARLRALRAEHGDLQLLLVHSGGRQEEYALHQRFAELRVTGEWFTAMFRLTHWIRRCRLDPANDSQPPGVATIDAIRKLTGEGYSASVAAAKRARA